jgi:hypothetical protein
MGSRHLEEELIGGVVNLDLLFQIPQKYARIIGGKGEEASSRGSTMEVREIHSYWEVDMGNCSILPPLDRHSPPILYPMSFQFQQSLLPHASSRH